MSGSHPEFLVDRDPIERLAESFLARYRRGERPSLTEYTQRHPELAEEIRELFPAMIMVEQLGTVGDGGSGAEAVVAGSEAMPSQLGEYRILREVGRGGMGVVFEAVQESLGRHVALKILPFHRWVTSIHLERFRREARAAARLHHSNIVPVFGVGEVEGVHYYAMQFIQGQGLDAVLRELRRLRGLDSSTTPGKGPGHGRGHGVSNTAARGLLAVKNESSVSDRAPSLEHDPFAFPSDPGSSSEFAAQSVLQYFRSVARLGSQVANALAYAHKQGILHRDIKPSNLLLDTQGTVWVTDFGLAKVEGTDDLTNVGDVVGTLNYMAPERFRGHSDPRGDIYSLGITLYQLLTLRHAFEESDRARLIERLARESPPRPRSIDRRIPRDLESVVLRAIAREPADRYPTAESLSEDLRRVLDHRPLQARRYNPVVSAGRWCRRNPAVAAMTASILALLVVIATGASIAALRLNRAATSLSSAHETALTHLDRALRAEQDVEAKLGDSLRAQARAERRSGRPGQRFRSLELLGLATLKPERGASDSALRDEAIACLTRPDLRVVREWSRCPPGTHAIGVDLDRGRFARADTLGKITVRRLEDDGELLALDGLDPGVWQGTFSDDGRYYAARSNARLAVWNLARGRPEIEVVTEATIDFSRDGRLAAIARADGWVSIHHLETGEVVHRFRAGVTPYAVRFHPRGRRLAVSSKLPARHDPPGDPMHPVFLVEIHDLKGEAPTVRLSHAHPVRGIDWRYDGRLLAAASGFEIHVWNTADPAAPARVATLSGHQSETTEVRFSHRGTLLATTSWDGTLRLWNPLFDSALVVTPATVVQLRFSRDDDRLGLTMDEPNVQLWEVSEGRERRTLYGLEVEAGKGPWTVAYSPDGRYLASASDGGVRLWDAANDRQLAWARWLGAQAVVFDPRGDGLIVSGWYGLERWPILQGDPASNDLVRFGPAQPLIPRVKCGMMALSHDGRSLAVQTDDTARVLNLDDHGATERCRLAAHPSLAQIAISPDGLQVATGTWLGSGVKVFDGRRGNLLHEFPDLKSARVAFSPDGRSLVAGAIDAVHRWTTRDWTAGPVLPRDRGGALSAPIAFSPDGRLLAFALSQRVVRLIDPLDGRVLADMETSQYQLIEGLCFSPDGHLLAAACSRHQIQVWDLQLLQGRLARLGLDWSETTPPTTPVDQAE